MTAEHNKNGNQDKPLPMSTADIESLIRKANLPDKSGEEILKEIKEFDTNIPVIIVSGQEEIGIAVQLLKLGAYDYIIKDEETKERLEYALTNAKRNIRLVNEININFNFESFMLNAEGQKT